MIRIKQQILDVIFRYVPPDTATVFLFGSQAEKTASERSDIDIGIICDQEVADEAYVAICEALDIEVDTLRKIDFVDFRKTDPSFRNFALENIELWHTARNFNENL